jgi:hypothetical protein
MVDHSSLLDELSRQVWDAIGGQGGSDKKGTI